MKNYKCLSSALGELHNIRHSPMKTLGILSQRTSKFTKKCQFTAFVNFHLSKNFSSETEKFVSIARMESSCVKSKDQMYWNFKAREWCSPCCFVSLSDTENICAQFSEADSKHRVMDGWCSSSVDRWNCYKRVIASVWNCWRCSAVESYKFTMVSYARNSDLQCSWHKTKKWLPNIQQSKPNRGSVIHVSPWHHTAYEWANS